jgi:hypothetical protein
MKEIKRNAWSKFCRQFTAQNQYRQANVTIIDRNNKESGLTGNLPFLGMVLQKNGRLIDGVKLFAGQWQPDKLMEPVLVIREPEKLMLDKDAQGVDQCLWIQTADGSKARIELHGERDQNLQRELVEKVAYAIFERRGYSNGNDINDWLEAERLVKSAESIVTQ